MVINKWIVSQIIENSYRYHPHLNIDIQKFDF